MKKLLMLILVVAMSMVSLIGCTNEATNDEVANSSEAVSVEGESYAFTEEESENVSEETLETESEKVNEEAEDVAEYSAETVMELADEIILQYPNENPEMIKAVALGTNAKYMTEDDIQTVLDAYGFTKERVNELFIEYFEMKGRMLYVHDQILEGATFEMPDYESYSPIYLYCLSEEEYNECVDMENAVLDAFNNNKLFQEAKEREIINDVESKSIAKMLIYGTTEGFQEYYHECLPFVIE